jgi:catechol 2,3-dioxygenase-like lactoylglutathione lyase family enzyme
MAYRLGQMIDHLGLRVSDFPAARRFYLALFDALGRSDEVGEGPDGIDLDELYIGPSRAGGPVTTGLHLCLQAKDRAMVIRAHAAGLAAGGRDNGPPGLRDYHPGYFAAFLWDPDGNNIELKADERVSARTAPFIEVTTA